jgi:hypothetical protein
VSVVACKCWDYSGEICTIILVMSRIKNARSLLKKFFGELYGAEKRRMVLS